MAYSDIDLRIMARKALLYKDGADDDRARFSELVGRLVARLGMNGDDVIFHIRLLAA